jgi:hypothetical protein
MSKLRLTHLLSALCTIAGPHIGLVPQEYTEQVKDWAPYAVGTILINIFFPHLIWLGQLAGGLTVRVTRKTVDTSLLGLVTVWACVKRGTGRLQKRVERLQKEKEIDKTDPGGREVGGAEVRPVPAMHATAHTVPQARLHPDESAVNEPAGGGDSE